MIDDIYSRTPINKTAAMVTSQSGCCDEISIEDRRDTLKRSKESLQRELDGLPKNHRYRKEIGEKILQIQKEMTLLRKQRKFAGAKDRDLNNYIIDVIKESVPAYKFQEWISIARARKEDEILKSEKALGGL